MPLFSKLQEEVISKENNHDTIKEKSVSLPEERLSLIPEHNIDITIDNHSTSNKLQVEINDTESSHL